MAIGIGIGLSPSFGGGPTVPLPATQTISFGAKTRTGHGAHLLGYTGSGTLSITSGNGSGHWQISQNALSPKGAGAYGTAGPTFAGPYTLIVTDGTYSSTVTINIVANAAHIREMASVANGGRWATDSVYTVDGTGSGGTHQLRTIFAGSILARGDTVWCRDGTLDPTTSGLRVRPAASYTGSGLITVRSETVDSSDDEHGMPNRKHGFKLRSLTWDSTTSGDVFFPVEMRDLWFEPNGNAAIRCTGYNSAGWGVSHVNCRFNAGADLASPALCDGVFVRGNATDAVDLSYCTFTNLGRAITVTQNGGAPRTTAATVKWNDGFLLFEDFIQDSGAGTIVEYNFCRDFVTGGSGVHPDFYQHTGAPDGSTFDGPTIRYNSCVLNLGVATYSAQLFFLEDSVGTGRLTNVQIKWNTGVSQHANGIVLNRTTSPDIRFNTVLSVVGGDIGSGSPVQVNISVPSGKGGTGGTFTYNVSNGFNVAAQTAPAASSPNDQLVTLTTTTDLVAMPNYVESGIYTRDQAKAALTPGDVALASGGFKETDNKYNGALGPDGDWNTGAAY